MDTLLLMENICAYPWRHITNRLDGTVSPCCEYKELITKSDGTPFNIKVDSLEEIYNSEYMESLRNDFLNGIKRDICNGCWNLEEVGAKSKRIRHLEYLENNKLWDTNNPTRDKLPNEYQLSLNNSCNLKCRMCGPWYSSSWLKEDKEHKIFYFNAFKNQVSSSDSRFIVDVEDWIPYVEEIEVLGGEPLYSSAWYKLLELIIEKGYNKNLRIKIVTNGTIFDKEVIEKWIDKFKQVDISISIDGAGKVFEYLRTNAKWNEVKDNIQNFTQYMRKGEKFKSNFNVNIHSTLSWMSILSITDLDKSLFSDLDTYNVYPSLTFNWVIEPVWLSLPFPPKFFTEFLINELQKQSFYKDSIKQELLNYLSLKKSEVLTDVDIEKEFKFIKKLDQIRNDSFLDIVRDISEELFIYYKPIYEKVNTGI